MTRGTLVILYDGKIIVSTEFNGDQYPDGYGAESFFLLEQVRNIPEFRAACKKVNEHYGYEERLVYTIADSSNPEDRDFIEFLHDLGDYWGKKPEHAEIIDARGGWFSDYLFIKNLEPAPHIFKCGVLEFDRPRGGEDIDMVLEPGETACFEFGKLVPSEVFDIYRPAWEKAEADGVDYNPFYRTSAPVPYASLSDTQRNYVESESSVIRYYAAKELWGLDKLVYDPSPSVRRAASCDKKYLPVLVHDESDKVREMVAYQGYGLDLLSNDSSHGVRKAVEVYLDISGTTLDEWILENPGRCALPENQVQGRAESVSDLNAAKSSQKAHQKNSGEPAQTGIKQ